MAYEWDMNGRWIEWIWVILMDPTNYNHSYWWYSCNDDVMLLHSWEVPWPQVTFRLCSSSDQPPWSPECGMKPLGAEQTFPLVFLFNHKAVEHSMDFAGPRILQSGTANPAPQHNKYEKPTWWVSKGCHWTCGTFWNCYGSYGLCWKQIMPHILCPFI